MWKAKLHLKQAYSIRRTLSATEIFVLILHGKTVFICILRDAKDISVRHAVLVTGNFPCIIRDRVFAFYQQISWLYFYSFFNFRRPFSGEDAVYFGFFICYQVTRTVVRILLLLCLLVRGKVLLDVNDQHGSL